jgi:hypothetical protein
VNTRLLIRSIQSIQRVLSAERVLSVEQHRGRENVRASTGAEVVRAKIASSIVEHCQCWGVKQRPAALRMSNSHILSRPVKSVHTSRSSYISYSGL